MNKISKKYDNLTFLLLSKWVRDDDGTAVEYVYSWDGSLNSLLAAYTSEYFLLYGIFHMLVRGCTCAPYAFALRFLLDSI